MILRHTLWASAIPRTSGCTRSSSRLRSSISATCCGSKASLLRVKRGWRLQEAV
jgi:hypothetical protein